MRILLPVPALVPMNVVARVVCFLSLGWVTPGVAAPPATPPAIPEVLAPLKATLKGVGVPSATIPIDVGSPHMLSITSWKPLTEEQWAAVESLGIRALELTGRAADDDALARLVKLDPTALVIWDAPFSDVGAAHFADMKSLKALSMVHSGRLTSASAASVAEHPSLEFLNAHGAWAGDPEDFAKLMTASRLRYIGLGHFDASDENCREMEKHPAIEELWLWPEGSQAALTDAGVASLATLPNLKRLSIQLTRLTYDGSLKHFKNVPGLEKIDIQNVDVSEEDLARLKADLPKTKIIHTPMKEGARKDFDGWITAKKTLDEIMQLPAEGRDAKIKELGKSNEFLAGRVNSVSHIRVNRIAAQLNKLPPEEKKAKLAELKERDPWLHRHVEFWAGMQMVNVRKAQKMADEVFKLPASERRAKLADIEKNDPGNYAGVQAHLRTLQQASQK